MNGRRKLNTRPLSITLSSIEYQTSIAFANANARDERPRRSIYYRVHARKETPRGSVLNDNRGLPSKFSEGPIIGANRGLNLNETRSCDRLFADFRSRLVTARVLIQIPPNRAPSLLNLLSLGSCGTSCINSVESSWWRHRTCRRRRRRTPGWKLA